MEPNEERPAKASQPDQITQSANYHSYLVRLWQEYPQTAWRTSVQDVQTGETTRFADLDALFAFLLARFGQDKVDQAGSSAAHASNPCDS